MPEAVADPTKLGFCPDRLARIRPWMDSYVDSGKLPGALTLIARHGEIAYVDHCGMRDSEAGKPWEKDSIHRFYSMTKPITSVALMMLYEKGLFHLDDPIEAYIPSMANRQVLIPDATDLGQTTPAESSITVHQVLTHTAGFTYGFNGGVLGEEYERRKMVFGPTAGKLESVIDDLAELPIAFQPGSRWNYGVSTDVVGRLVEIISGQPLRTFLQENILGPLGMTDTDFHVPDSKIDRFSNCYTVNEKGERVLLEAAEKSAYREGKVACYSGGGGLVSTAADYLKFAEMLRRGGICDGHRLLSNRTVNFMTGNHMDGDLADMGQPVFSEVSFAGVGFGLGFWSMLNPAKAQMMGNPGDHGWGGMASTVFWVDPVEDMVVLYLTQLVPSAYYPIRKELRALVHQALVD